MSEIQVKGSSIIFDDADAWLVMGNRWHIRRSGRCSYAMARIGGKPVLMHRLIIGATKGQIVDHINGYGLDNRRANLRFVTPGQNAYNSHSKSEDHYFPRGVHRNGQLYYAAIRANGCSHYLGKFTTAEEAGEAYKRAAERLHGEFAYHLSRPAA